MATKDARGTKRTCQECGARFYDLNREEIICPICGSEYEIAHAAPEEVIEDEKLKDTAKVPTAADADEDDTVAEEDEAAEIADIGDDDEIEDTDDDGAPFLEEDEEDSGNVTDIIKPALDEGEET